MWKLAPYLPRMPRISYQNNFVDLQFHLLFWSLALHHSSLHQYWCASCYQPRFYLLISSKAWIKVRWRQYRPHVRWIHHGINILWELLNFYVINQWSLTFLKQIFIKQKKVSRSTLVPSCLHHGIILNKIPQLLMSTKLEIFRIPQLLMSTKLEKKRNRES